MHYPHFPARALLAATLLFPSTVNAQTRIVCLGDSITQADSAHQSYRYRLWKKLIDAGADFDLVGSLSTNYNGSPSLPLYLGKTFDPNHEGHWGLRTDEILQNLPGWLTGYTADVALVHLGSNDLIQGNSIASTVAEISSIIDALRTDNPAIVILLAQIIPYSSGYPNSSNVPQFNTQLASLAPSKSTAQSPVILVDQFTGFDAIQDTIEGVHPNPSGEEKMATRWLQSLALHLATALEKWRQTYFHTPLDAGNAADTFDFDGDGLVNLIEFAFGLNPTQPDRGQLPQFQISNGNLVYNFTQPAGVSGIRYSAEWSESLAGTWTSVTSTGIAPQWVFSVPQENRARIFMRLVVSSP